MPVTHEKIDAVRAMMSILSNEFVSKKPIAPGAMSMAMTRIMPAAFNEATIVSASNMRRLKCRSFIGRPMTLAWAGSKQ